ncbi:hypothetical protein GCM10010206_66580 [Streptomyces cinerochromogenes]|nr:hypothetical protein GCM10010206_66580 [Streptomyces cinerochromogenes]
MRRATVSGREPLKKPAEPRGPEREAYARLLNKLAGLYPAAAAAAGAAPTTFTCESAPTERTLSTRAASEAAGMTAPENTQTAAPAEQAVPRLARTARRTSTSRRPGTRKAAPANTLAGGTDPRFKSGPLAVVGADGQVLAYCTGGLVLDVPAKEHQGGRPTAADLPAHR